MKRLIVLLTAIVLFVVVGWFAWVYAQQSRLPTLTDVQQIPNQAIQLLSGVSPPQQLPTIQMPTLDQKIVDSVHNQTATIAGEASKVLGTAIQVSSGSADKPLPERALDFARYQYCKQVVEEYER